MRKDVKDMKVGDRQISRTEDEVMGLIQEKNKSQRTGEPIVCDCCGMEVMAIRHADRIVITDKRHGRHHIVIIPLTSLQR